MTAHGETPTSCINSLLGYAGRETFEDELGQGCNVPGVRSASSAILSSSNHQSAGGFGTIDRHLEHKLGVGLGSKGNG
jgi:hypothetical protein